LNIPLGGCEIHFEDFAKFPAKLVEGTTAVAKFPYETGGLIELVNQALAAVEHDRFAVDDVGSDVGSTFRSKK
jgi:hypothetical protein